MNFDMALDAYAAVIEIDENEPRAYLGRAGVYRALAAQTAENAETEEDLNSARNYADLAGEDTDHAEEIIQSDEYGQGEDSPVTPEDIEASRKENEDLLDIILRRIIQITEVDVDAVVQEVLSLPYIGNTSYGEYMTEASADLYDGEGYISAVLMDLDGDEQDEILVISLEGEDALGGGNNAMYLHVLEYSGEGWGQTAVRNIETDPQSILLSSYRMQPLNRDIFLRQEEDITVVYAETSASDYASYTGRAWSLFRYIYDGEGIDLAGIGDTAPGEAEVDGHFYLFDRETAMYVPDGDPDQAARIWDVFDKISAAGIPILKDGSLVAGVMRSDPSFIPMASFSRR